MVADMIVMTTTILVPPIDCLIFDVALFVLPLPFISSMGELAPSHSASLQEHVPKLVDTHIFSHPGNVQGMLGNSMRGTASMTVHDEETVSTATVEQSDETRVFLFPDTDKSRTSPSTKTSFEKPEYSPPKTLPVR